MSWYPEIYTCRGCGAMYLEMHPAKCHCGRVDWSKCEVAFDTLRHYESHQCPIVGAVDDLPECQEDAI